MPVATRVKSDPLMPAVGTSFDVTAQSCGATGLDRRHDLKLAEAQVAGMGGAMGGTGRAKDIGDLNGGAHRSGVGWRLCRNEDAEFVERTDDGAHPACNHVGIEGRRLELGVAEQHLTMIYSTSSD